MFTRIARFAITVSVGAATILSGVLIGATPAHADGCYTWHRALSRGASGEDVRQLQIRVSGYPGYRAMLSIDGRYGPATAAAVARFQRAYGLPGDGVAGPKTFEKIYSLQDNDCTPSHFKFAELNNCNTGWTGGAVPVTQAKTNALVNMWKLEALRHALGDRPIGVSSAFRSRSCNTAVGGVPTSRHLYGDAVDLLPGPNSLCRLAQQARNHGFNEILGPGYPGHSDHVHVARKASRTWSASQCGVR